MASKSKKTTTTLKDLAEAANEASEIEKLADDLSNQLEAANHKIGNLEQEIVLLKAKLQRLETPEAMTAEDVKRLAEANSTIEFKRADFRTGKNKVIITTNTRPRRVLQSETFSEALALFRSGEKQRVPMDQIV